MPRDEEHNIGLGASRAAVRRLIHDKLVVANQGSTFQVLSYLGMGPSRRTPTANSRQPRGRKTGF